jgi:hypothetical protein
MTVTTTHVPQWNVDSVILWAPVVEEPRGALGDVCPLEFQREEDAHGDPAGVGIAHAQPSPHAKEDDEYFPHTQKLRFVWRFVDPQPVALLVDVQLEVTGEPLKHFPVRGKDFGHDLGGGRRG